MYYGFLCLICFDKKTSEKRSPKLFFCNWQKEPYDENGKMLIAEKVEDRQTKRKIGAPDKPRGAEFMALTQKLLIIGTFDH